MNIANLVRAYDALMGLRDAARRFKDSAAGAKPETSLSPTAAQGLAGQIESRLTNVVVAALKEACGMTAQNTWRSTFKEKSIRPVE